MQRSSHDSEVPAHGQQVLTACAFIHQEQDGIQKVFMPKRAMTKKFLPGAFELPGGHIDFGEDMVTGLKREVFEEFNVHINVGDPFGVFTYTNEVKGSHSIEVVYFATLADSSENIKLDPEYHSEYRWVAENELDEVRPGVAGEDDQELVVIRRGFGLLRGDAVNFT